MKHETCEGKDWVSGFPSGGGSDEIEVHSIARMTNPQYSSMRVFKTHIRVEVLIARFLFLLLGSPDWLFSSLDCVFFSMLLTTLELSR